MATADPTAPARAHLTLVPSPAPATLEVPAVIAGSVNPLRFTEALARAGLVGRHDAGRGVLVIEPVPERCPQCGGGRCDEDAACDACGSAGCEQEAEQKCILPANTAQAIEEYNALTETERRHWHRIAGSAVSAEAWAAWKAHRDSTI